jgi:hypothetical protein
VVIEQALKLLSAFEEVIAKKTSTYHWFLMPGPAPGLFGE